MKTVIGSLLLLVIVLALVAWSFASPSKATFILDWNRGWLDWRLGNMAPVREPRAIVDGKFDAPGLHIIKRHLDEPNSRPRLFWQWWTRVCSAWVTPLFVPVLLLVGVKRLRTRRRTVIGSILLLIVLALIAWSFAGPYKAAFVLQWHQAWLDWHLGNMDPTRWPQATVDGKFDVPGLHILKRHYDDPTVYTRPDGSTFRILLWQWSTRICSAWVTPIFVPMLLVGVKRVRTRRRCAGGCCTNCGYDLRASTGDCPECGGGRAADGFGGSE